MPVTSIATERTPWALSQSRSSCNWPVVVPNTFGRPPATETCNCSLPTSMAAAVGSSTGKEGVVMGYYSLGRPHRRARPGSEKTKSFQREAKGSPINAPVASRNQSLQRAARNRARHSTQRSRCATLRTSRLLYQVHGPNACGKNERGLSMNRTRNRVESGCFWLENHVVLAGQLLEQPLFGLSDFLF